MLPIRMMQVCYRQSVASTIVWWAAYRATFMRYLLRDSTIVWAATLIVLLLVGCTAPAGDTAETAAPMTLESSSSTTSNAGGAVTPAPSALPASTQLPYPGPASDMPPAMTPQSDPYPVPDTPIAESDSAGATASADVYMPITSSSSLAETAANEVLPTPTAVPTVDFKAVEAQLQASGRELGFVKLGFHVTLLEDRDILDEWLFRLDQALRQDSR
jgi:hypothetical protein